MACRNLGSSDRLFRVIAGSGLLLAAIFSGRTWGWVMGAVSLALLISGLTGFCVLYSLLGVNTCKT